MGSGPRAHIQSSTRPRPQITGRGLLSSSREKAAASAPINNAANFASSYFGDAGWRKAKRLRFRLESKQRFVEFLRHPQDRHVPERSTFVVRGSASAVADAGASARRGST